MPNESFAVTTHRVIVFATFSPFGAISGDPKSTTSAILFRPGTALVVPHILLNKGFTDGGVDGMSLLSKVNTHPSTDPSAISTEGPVIAAFQTVLLGAAW